MLVAKTISAKTCSAVKQNNLRIVGLIQARMNSKRLPGKALIDLCGKPVISHIYSRLSEIIELSEIVLATGAGEENNSLVDWARRQQGIGVIQHEDDDDIAGRLSKAVKATDADFILKVNADCPLFDPMLGSKAIKLAYANPSCDLVTNKSDRTYPLGLSVELLSGYSLIWCDNKLRNPTDRELTINYVLDRPEQFQQHVFGGNQNFGHLDLTLDTQDDLLLIRKIFEDLYPQNNTFGWIELRAWINKYENLPTCAYLGGGG